MYERKAAEELARKLLGVPVRVWRMPAWLGRLTEGRQWIVDAVCWLVCADLTISLVGRDSQDRITGEQHWFVRAVRGV